MAGSYSHATTDKGALRRESFTDMVENLGDAFETVEEMYGMIWYLVAQGRWDDPVAIVEDARQNYTDGISYAERIVGRAP